MTTFASSRLRALTTFRTCTKRSTLSPQKRRRESENTRCATHGPVGRVRNRQRKEATENDRVGDHIGTGERLARAAERISDKLSHTKIRRTQVQQSCDSTHRCKQRSRARGALSGGSAAFAPTNARSGGKTVPGGGGAFLSQRPRQGRLWRLASGQFFNTTWVARLRRIMRAFLAEFAVCHEREPTTARASEHPQW